MKSGKHILSQGADQEPSANQQVIPPNFLTKFRYTRIQLISEATSHIKLPLFAGSAFRGIFGRALRKVACVARNTKCPECPLAARCAYPAVFEFVPNGSLPIYKTVSNPPRPFVLEPPNEREIPSGVVFKVRLTLFGKAIDHWPWVIQAFALAGHRGVGPGTGTFKVRRALTASSQDILVEGDRIMGQPEIIPASDLSCPELSDHLGLRFETPVRIKRNGHLVDSLEFSTLVRQLLRRIALIGAFHCDVLLNTDFRKWISLADKVTCHKENLHWFDWIRYSSRQNRKMHLGGLVGRVRYTGDFAPFTPLLTLGQITHLGKGTTFGLGRYRLMERTL